MTVHLSGAGSVSATNVQPALIPVKTLLVALPIVSVPARLMVTLFPAVSITKPTLNGSVKPEICGKLTVMAPPEVSNEYSLPLSELEIVNGELAEVMKTVSR